jgi:hypothetical protein
MKQQITVESSTKEDAETHGPKCRSELPNSESSNHGSETGVHLKCGSTSVPRACDENAGCYPRRNTGTNTTP